ncbi:hypothetical protein EON65_56335 [archaeon]|nr:MAG: hypothetical protein EON65_56335 [archaeon]
MALSNCVDTKSIPLDILAGYVPFDFSKLTDHAEPIRGQVYLSAVQSLDSCWIPVSSDTTL